MYRTMKILTLLILAALLMSACQPVVVLRSGAPASGEGLRPDALDYVVRGPYTDSGCTQLRALNHH